MISVTTYSSFYSNIPDSEINTIASNVKHVVGKDPSLTQTLEKEISNIFKSKPATAMMEHDKLAEYLHNELKKLGFNDLEKVDILKFATMIRDPVTKETVVPFETRHTKTDEMKNLAWEKIHQEALGHFQNKDLKLAEMSQNSLIQNDIMTSTPNGSLPCIPSSAFVFR